MNQILVTEKLYITPELRRKKKMYKLQFFLSVLLVCLLFSYYIYAEYDRSKSEEVSKEILQSIEEASVQNTYVEKDTTIKEQDGIIIVAIDDDESDNNQIIEEQTPIQNVTYNTKTGIEYYAEAIVNIPRLGINYPVITSVNPKLSESEFEELLKLSVCKYWGPNPNEIGNYCIVGHNYKSGKMFGNLPAITNGDIIELTDGGGKGKTVKYSVIDRYVIDPTDLRCTSQLTNGQKELTLITCKEYGQKRLVVKAREIK